jgi:tetratricopeptide (TPR) repeat protein
MTQTIPRPAAATTRGARRLLAPVAIAVAAGLAFASVLPGSSFVFDDHVLIEKNMLLRRADVWWAAFGRDYFETSEHPGGSGYYRPVATLTDAVDVRVWRGSARGSHITNLVLHAAASVAVGPALVALGATPAAAWIAALVFAVHPAHAESVAFVSGRGDVLAGLWTFIALALAASARRFAVFAFGFATLAAYLSKEAAIVLPLLVGLVWMAQRSHAPSVDESSRNRWQMLWIVLAVTSLVAFVMRYTALGRLLPASAGNAGGFGVTLPLQSLGFALASLYAPQRRLAMEPDPALLSLLHVVAGVAVAALLWLASRRVDPESRPFLRRAAIAAAIALVPVLNWLPQETRLSERFLYLASGFAFAPIGVLVRWGWLRGGTWRPAVAGAAAVAVLLLLGTSAWRARAWRDDIVVWRIATAEEPQRALFWSRYGLALLERHSLTDAERALGRAIELDPKDFAAQQHLGIVLHQQDRPALAITQYEKALALQPRNVYLLLNMAMSEAAIGNVRGAYDRTLQALEIAPNHFDATRSAGGYAVQLGMWADARRHLEAALRQRPGDPALHQQLDGVKRREARPPAP